MSVKPIGTHPRGRVGGKLGDGIGSTGDSSDAWSNRYSRDRDRFTSFDPRNKLAIRRRRESNPRPEAIGIHITFCKTTDSFSNHTNSLYEESTTRSSNSSNSSTMPSISSHSRSSSKSSMNCCNSRSRSECSSGSKSESSSSSSLAAFSSATRSSFSFSSLSAALLSFVALLLILLWMSLGVHYNLVVVSPW